MRLLFVFFLLFFNSIAEGRTELSCTRRPYQPFVYAGSMAYPVNFVRIAFDDSEKYIYMRQLDAAEGRTVKNILCSVPDATLESAACELAFPTEHLIAGNSNPLRCVDQRASRCRTWGEHNVISDTTTHRFRMFESNGSWFLRLMPNANAEDSPTQSVIFYCR